MIIQVYSFYLPDESLKRNNINQHGVDNLYIKRDSRSKTGFSCQYKDPRFGLKEFGEIKQFRSLGSDVSTAIQKARQLNCLILPKLVEQRVKDIFDSPSITTKSIKMKDWVAKYCEIQEIKLQNGYIKPNTWRAKRHIVRTISIEHGELRLSAITTKLVKELLDKYVNQRKNRMAQSVRAAYKDLFVEAAQAGEVESSFNPAKVTKNPKARIEKSRLSLEQFNQIVSCQNYHPHKYAYILALLTGQRRSDISLIRKSKGSDWDHKFDAYRKNSSYFIEERGGYASFAQLVKHAPYSYVDGDFLHVFQLKTGKLLKLPLSLRLIAFDLTIKEAIEKANVINDSEFVVHHTTARACNELGDPLHPDTVSRSFKRARDAAKIEWKATPATFHEIRSLSERLYRAQGVDTKVLCGHRHQETTDRYNNMRGLDWETLSI